MDARSLRVGMDSLVNTSESGGEGFDPYLVRNCPPRQLALPGGTDDPKEIDMADTTERRRLSLEYLMRVADDINRIANQRVYYVQTARKYGATHQDIASALGVTEGAVRSILRRYGSGE